MELPSVELEVPIWHRARVLWLEAQAEAVGIVGARRVLLRQNGIAGGWFRL